MTAPLFQEATTPEPAVAPEQPPAATDTQPDPMAPDENAPHGYMIDPDTKERRPKLRPGRTRPAAAPKVPKGVTPSLDELKAMKDAAGPAKAREDVAPQPPKKAGKAGQALAKMTAESDKPFRAGPIAKGVNKLYKRAGKIISLADREIGGAVILCTEKDDEDDTTVGEAWEELARVNPRIRGFLERLIQGGAWTSLFYAHLPIFMAILMKDSIRARLPLANLIMAFVDNDDDDQDGEDGPGPMGGLMGDLQPGDMAQMMAMAQQMMGNLGMQMPRQPDAPARDAAA